MSTPIYSYSQPKVEARLVKAFRSRRREATVADLIAATGLPRLQIEETLPQVIHNYRGHLRATESGEILYYFPHGLHHRERSTRARLGKFLRSTARGAAAVGRIGFKIWIMLMLVGYFVLFVALVIAALAASVAASAKSDNRSRGRGIGGTYMMTRLVQQIIFLWMFSGHRSSYGGQRRFGARPGAGPGAGWNMRRSQDDGPPLHQSVFAFVFGGPAPLADWPERERRAFIQLVQTHRGIVTLEELRALTGTGLDQAQDVMNQLMLEYDGEPDVTESGSLIYRFPELLRTAEPSDRRGGSVKKLLPDMPQIPFSGNTPGMNRWIAVLNGVNLGFGSYFTVFSLMGTLPEQGFGVFFTIVIRLLAEISAAPFGLAYIGLGLVPLVFSLLFYLIPFLRNRRRINRNREIAMRNARRQVLQELLSLAAANETDVRPEDLRAPAQSGQKAAYLDQALNEFAAEQHADITTPESAPAGQSDFNAPRGFTYRFVDLARQLQDVQAVRAAINPDDYRTGKVVFDSQE